MEAGAQRVVALPVPEVMAALVGRLGLVEQELPLALVIHHQLAHHRVIMVALHPDPLLILFIQLAVVVGLVLLV